jgi:micrococcal nuclease
MRTVRSALLLFALGACSGQRSASAPTGSTVDVLADARNGTGAVERVVDGDTLVVRIAGRQERLRLIGMDTPESVKEGTAIECFAREASSRTKALLPTGTAIRIARDVEARDRFGRLLGYVYRQDDGLFVNLTLLREGYAATLTFPPNVAHADEFVAAARDAREAGRGLWSRCGGPHEPNR